MLDYNKLFNTLGLDDEWQTANKSRIDLFLDRITVRTQEEIDHAYETLTFQYETGLEGVRGMLAVCTKEAIDWVLAKDEHEIVLNFGRPVFATLSQGMVVGERKYGGKYYARGTSCMLSELILGSVFDKMHGIIDIGEEMGQQNGRGHCSLYQALVGAMEIGMFPVPDLEIACGFFCDQAPEAEALMHELFKDKGGGYNVLFADRPMDHQWDSWPDVDRHTTELLAIELDRVYETLAKDWGFELTPEDFEAAHKESGQLTPRFLALVKLMNEAERQPISQVDMGLVMWLWAVSSFYFDEMMVALRQFEKDMRQKIRDGEGVTSKGAPRVYCTFRYAADMQVIKLIENELDLAIPVCWMDVFPPDCFLAPSNCCDDPSDWIMYEILSRFITMGDNMGTLKSWDYVAQNYKLDGIIHFLPMFCRPYAMPAMMGKNYIQKTTGGLPYLLMEMDTMDTRYYNAGQARTRLESFAEVVRMNKAMKDAEKAEEAAAV